MIGADCEQYGKNLQRIRINAGISRSELCQLIGVTQVTMSSWERGLNYPRAESITKLAAALGVSRNVLAKPLRTEIASDRLLCGECRHWWAEGVRTEMYQIGKCDKDGARTERCDWCRHGCTLRGHRLTEIDALRRLNTARNRALKGCDRRAAAGH